MVGVSAQPTGLIGTNKRQNVDVTLSTRGHSPWRVLLGSLMTYSVILAATQEGNTTSLDFTVGVWERGPTSSTTYRVITGCALPYPVQTEIFRRTNTKKEGLHLTWPANNSCSTRKTEFNVRRNRVTQ